MGEERRLRSDSLPRKRPLANGIPNGLPKRPALAPAVVKPKPEPEEPPPAASVVAQGLRHFNSASLAKIQPLDALESRP